jgi:Ricin-type beta-trefoil lectin domain/Putative Ig domain
MRVRRRRQRLAGALALAVAAAGLVSLAVSAPASAASTHAAASTAQTAGSTQTAGRTAQTAGKPLPAGEREVCPTPTSPGVMACLSVIKTGTRAAFKPDLANPFAYEPGDLQKAYNLVAASKSRGKGMTVAIVDGGDDPDAAKNLAAYRKEWGLPACNSGTGAGCLVKVNQSGKASPLPIADPTGSWEIEESLDLDMVSAICPNCRILLVEASFDAANIPNEYDPGITQFAAAENSAVALGARFVSNSWGGPEAFGDQAYNSAFQHPGVAITVAAGDAGYGVSYPASTQFVTSVGGTSLLPATGKGRGWTESAWTGTGSGCSAIQAKPAWQTVDDTSPDGCLTRTDNDVSAVADPNTGVWIYDTYPYLGQTLDWESVGGTSAASPIVAAVYALAGKPKAGTYPASYLYQKGHSADLYPATGGTNGWCETFRAYLCHGEPGYDAPTGLGTPDGIGAFASSTAGNTISVTDPGTLDVASGAKLSRTLQATDSAGKALTWTAKNLPKGLSVSKSGVISGTPAKTTTALTSKVTVTAADATGAKGSASFSLVVTPDLAAGYAQTTGQVAAVFTSMCLDDTGNATANGTAASFAPCATSSEQDWALVPDAAPDGSQTLQINGKCLATASTASGSGVELETCNGSAREAWSLSGGEGTLTNPSTGLCLTDPNSSASTALAAEIFGCAANPTDGGSDHFQLPAGAIVSAVGSMCASDPGNSVVSGTAVELEPCDGGSAESWGDFSDFLFSATGEPATHQGLCLTALAQTNLTYPFEYLENTPVAVADCTPTGSEASGNVSYLNSDWATRPNGEILNLDTNLCLADRGSATAKGSKLFLEACDGDAGEIWAVG